jgi:O-acetyl-ADP-ribose deacetylase (regulator of RNase III)
VKEIFSKKIGHATLKVIEGDITEEETSAIVNAANSYLAHGGGVAFAIVKKGGREIQEESNKIVEEKGPIPFGEAVITKGYHLKAKYVIHVVGPRFGEGKEEEKLRKAIRSVLELAKEHGIKTISIPAISCGIFGFPKEKGTRIIVEETIKFLQENEKQFDEIHFIGVDATIPKLFKEALIND